MAFPYLKTIGAFTNISFTTKEHGDAYVMKVVPKRWLFVPLTIRDAKIYKKHNAYSSYGLFIARDLFELALLKERIRTFAFYRRKGTPLKTMDIRPSGHESKKLTEVVILDSTFSYLEKPLREKARIAALDEFSMPSIAIKSITSKGMNYGPPPSHKGVEKTLGAPDYISFTVTDTGVTFCAAFYRKDDATGDSYKLEFRSQHISNRDVLYELKELYEHDVSSTATSY